jgi:dynein heavy chain, axonemal
MIIKQFDLVRVDTTAAKQALHERALLLRDALLEALVTKARHRNRAIIAQYEAVLARIAEKPQNEAELAALKVLYCIVYTI